jgi:hypothetical protein
MTVKEIVIKYLKDNGYDGLYSDDCGCMIDDLIPCSGYGSMDMCELGVKKDCHECPYADFDIPAGNKNNCAEDRDFCIGKKE